MPCRRVGACRLLAPLLVTRHASIGIRVCAPWRTHCLRCRLRIALSLRPRMLSAGQRASVQLLFRNVNVHVSLIPASVSAGDSVRGCAMAYESVCQSDSLHSPSECPIPPIIIGLSLEDRSCESHHPAPDAGWLHFSSFLPNPLSQCRDDKNLFALYVIKQSIQLLSLILSGLKQSPLDLAGNSICVSELILSSLHPDGMTCKAQTSWLGSYKDMTQRSEHGPVHSCCALFSAYLHGSKQIIGA